MDEITEVSEGSGTVETAYRDSLRTVVLVGGEVRQSLHYFVPRVGRPRRVHGCAGVGKNAGRPPTDRHLVRLFGGLASSESNKGERS